MDIEDDLHNHTHNHNHHASHRRLHDDEMDQDHDMEGTSPSVGGDDDDAYDDSEEVERGRKGRPMVGNGNGNGVEKVKVKEELRDMETS